MISICVPYWNRQEALDAMFENYAQLYSDLPLEFSICDDGSPEPARVPDYAILTRLPTKEKPLNPCVPINRAVEASTGEIIVLTGAEMVHEMPVLYEMVKLLTDPMDYVTARCRWDIPEGDVVWIAGPEQQGSRGPCPPGGYLHFLAMLNRSLWTLAGGFDEEYRHGAACEDNDWLWRLWKVGANFKCTQSHVIQPRTQYRTRGWGGHNSGLLQRKWANVWNSPRRGEQEGT